MRSPVILFLSSILAHGMAFSVFRGRSMRASKMASDGDAALDPCLLPGDPSLLLTTNSDLTGLSGGKLGAMKAISKAISEVLGKPESYVCVAINQVEDMIWAGESTPCVLGTMTSLGAINLDNNRALQAKISDILAPAVAADRIYVTYMDVPRENLGYNGKTFAG